MRPKDVLVIGDSWPGSMPPTPDPRIIASEPALGLGALAAAAESRVVTYSSTAIDGTPTTMTGLIHLPSGSPPRGGWPVVTYGHMTTGAGARSAPSLAAADHPERRRMTQGDALCNRLLAVGVVVLRPDYEGIGGPGIHPYLVGRSLGTATLDLLVSARHTDERIGPRWVSAGHSEGSVAAAAAAIGHARQPVGADLRGVSLISPVTRTDRTIGMLVRLPVPVAPVRNLVPLTALMLQGAAVSDLSVAGLPDAGLSPRAKVLWPQLQERSLEELSATDSFGALAPSGLFAPGVAGSGLRAALLEWLRREDVRHVTWPGGSAVRVDWGAFDEVAPSPVTARLVRRWRAAGADVQGKVWPASHSTVLGERFAPRAIAEWIVRRLSG